MMADGENVAIVEVGKISREEKQWPSHPPRSVSHRAFDVEANVEHEIDTI